MEDSCMHQQLKVDKKCAYTYCFAMVSDFGAGKSLDVVRFRVLT